MLRVVRHSSITGTARVPCRLRLIEWQEINPRGLSRPKLPMGNMTGKELNDISGRVMKFLHFSLYCPFWYPSPCLSINEYG